MLDELGHVGSDHELCRAHYGPMVETRASIEIMNFSYRPIVAGIPRSM
jgi:hypothetical protein